MKFGAHVSIAGGVAQAPGRAAALGCDCFQVFVANPRSWAMPVVSDAKAEAFQEARRKAGVGPVAVHVTYLPNLASPEKGLYQKSLKHLLAQYAAAARIGAELFVIHPGSHRGSGLEAGVRRIAEGLRRVFDEVPEGPWLLLENTAGGGDTIGRTCEELASIARAADAPERVGVCLDTCHAHAMGVDVGGKGVFKKFLNEHARAVGAGAVKCIHANDALFLLGEGRDRHEHIGLGRIGEEGFRHILATPGVKKLPVIMETPVDERRGDRDNLAAIRALAPRK
ncbi:MAG: deoxyribonuclease IV [Planctomycetota bacterium]